MQHIKNKAATVVALSILALPFAAFAENTSAPNLPSDAQAQIQALLAQIKSLQGQIMTIVASSTPNPDRGASTSPAWNPGQVSKEACVSLKRNLRQGDSGEDVKNLQRMLKEDSKSGFNGSVTGFFGPLTMRAMMKFQAYMGIASSTDGSVGPLTRGFFERRCGNGLSDDSRGEAGVMGKMHGGMGAPIRGTISTVGASLFSISTANGSVTVLVSATTSIKVFAGTSTPPTVGSMNDLTTGKNVTVMGPKNPDGSIQAMDIMVGDILPMMKGGEKEMMDDKGGMRPKGLMPSMNGPQGPVMHGGPQNW